MRRTAFLFAFGALVAVACANSSTPDSTGLIVKSDASAEDTGSTYDAGYGPVTEDSGTVADTGPAVTDAGKKETSTVADTGAAPDTGSTTGTDCDPNDSNYDALFLALIFSGTTPPDCGGGCQTGECCYMPGAANSCLPQ